MHYTTNGKKWEFHGTNYGISKYMLNYLNGNSAAVYPDFVASGHVPNFGTSNPRLSTG